MSSVSTLTRRIEALEARLAELEGGFGNTLYQLHRRAVSADLSIGKVLDHLGLIAPTDDEIDAVIDES